MNAVVVAGLAGLAGVGGVVGIGEIAPDRQAPEPAPRVAAVLPTSASDDAELRMVERAERAVAAAEARTRRLERDRPVAPPPRLSGSACAAGGERVPGGTRGRLLDRGPRFVRRRCDDDDDDRDDHDDDGDRDDHDDDHDHEQDD